MKRTTSADAQTLTLLTIVSRLLAADPVHLPMIFSMHLLWIAALHSGEANNKFPPEEIQQAASRKDRGGSMKHSRLHL